MVKKLKGKNIQLNCFGDDDKFRYLYASKSENLGSLEADLNLEHQKIAIHNNLQGYSREHVETNIDEMLRNPKIPLFYKEFLTEYRKKQNNLSKLKNEISDIAFSTKATPDLNAITNIGILEDAGSFRATLHQIELSITQKNKSDLKKRLNNLLTILNAANNKLKVKITEEEFGIFKKTMEKLHNLENGINDKELRKKFYDVLSSFCNLSFENLSNQTIQNYEFIQKKENKNSQAFDAFVKYIPINVIHKTTEDLSDAIDCIVVNNVDSVNFHYKLDLLLKEILKSPEKDQLLKKFFNLLTKNKISVKKFFSTFAKSKYYWQIKLCADLREEFIKHFRENNIPYNSAILYPEIKEREEQLHKKNIEKIKKVLEENKISLFSSLTDREVGSIDAFLRKINSLVIEIDPLDLEIYRKDLLPKMALHSILTNNNIENRLYIAAMDAERLLKLTIFLLKFSDKSFKEDPFISNTLGFAITSLMKNEKKNSRYVYETLFNENLVGKLTPAHISSIIRSIYGTNKTDEYYLKIMDELFKLFDKMEPSVLEEIGLKQYQEILNIRRQHFIESNSINDRPYPAFKNRNTNTDLEIKFLKTFGAKINGLINKITPNETNYHDVSKSITEFNEYLKHLRDRYKIDDILFSNFLDNTITNVETIIKSFINFIKDDYKDNEVFPKRNYGVYTRLKDIAKDIDEDIKKMENKNIYRENIRTDFINICYNGPLNNDKNINDYLTNLLANKNRKELKETLRTIVYTLFEIMELHYKQGNDKKNKFAISLVETVIKSLSTDYKLFFEFLSEIKNKNEKVYDIIVGIFRKIFPKFSIDDFLKTTSTSSSTSTSTSTEIIATNTKEDIYSFLGQNVSKRKPISMRVNQSLGVDGIKIEVLHPETLTKDIAMINSSKQALKNAEQTLAIKMEINAERKIFIDSQINMNCVDFMFREKDTKREIFFTLIFNENGKVIKSGKYVENILLNSKDIDEASKMMAKNISNQILKGLIANDKKTTEAFLDILPLLYKTTSLLTKDNIKRSFLNLKNKTEESIIEFFEKHYEKTEDIDIIDNITTKMSIAILAASLHQEKTKGSFSI